MDSEQGIVKKIYARMEDNYHLTSKKGLLLNMKEYYQLQGKDVFDMNVFPLTYLIKEGVTDKEYDRLMNYYSEHP